MKNMIRVLMIGGVILTTGLVTTGELWATAQSSDQTTDNPGVKKDTKNAAKDTGKAGKAAGKDTKNAATKTGSEVKKGTKKGAHATSDTAKKGADKVTGKPAPQQ